jgi:hypothetical protein
MAQHQVKDSRGYFKLPQNPEQGGYGYYTYGTPGLGAGQFAHPKLISIINMVEHRWQGMDDRKIGFGNISLADGENLIRTRVIRAAWTWTFERSARTASSFR